jgi:F0F1-type ATP synthase assembly protein I
LEQHNEQKHQDEQSSKYLSSPEYEDKCKQMNIQRAKLHKDFVNFMDNVYLAIIAIATFIKYLCGSKPIDMFHDAKIIFIAALLNIMRIIILLVKITIIIIIFLLVLITIVSIMDTIKYYNNFSHL